MYRQQFKEKGIVKGKDGSGVCVASPNQSEIYGDTHIKILKQQQQQQSSNYESVCINVTQLPPVTNVSVGSLISINMSIISLIMTLINSVVFSM